MRVRFVGSGDLERRISQGAGSLRMGNEYLVLEIFAQVDGANKFRIEFSEEELPALFDSRLFEVSSNQIPQGWRITRNWNGSLIIGPEKWSLPGFWEAFMNGEGWAEQAYAAGRATLEQ